MTPAERAESPAAAEPSSPGNAPARPAPLVLDEAGCREVLAKAGWGVLATEAEGQPYGVPVGYALGRDCLYLVSGPGTKRRNLEANPRVCLTVVLMENYDRWRSVVVQGAATPVEGMAERGAAVAAFVAQRAPRARPGVTDVRRLLAARLLRVPLDHVSGRGRGVLS